ncbi:MAG: hypothetical protein AAB610_00530 [Patescibacteria group bacterium]
MDHSADNKKSSIFFGIIFFLLISVLAASYYIFYVSKNYDFTFNGDCDSSTQTCYVAEDKSNYRVFHLPARDFYACSTDGSCVIQCENDSIACEETMCSVDDGDVCSVREEN